jgi:hypothetical protein
MSQKSSLPQLAKSVSLTPDSPVFDAILEKAMLLCEAAFGILSTFDGIRIRLGPRSPANRISATAAL